MIPQYRISYSPAAIAVIAKIYTYIAQDSPENAEGMTERILAAIDLLGHFPRRQRAWRYGQSPDETVYSLPIPPYMIFFRISEHESVVRIAHIRHGARRPLKRF
jgi:plasmid stabilization system protein ParE